MEQIYLNTTEKLYLRIYVGGTLTDADGTVSVSVTDPAGTVLRTLNASYESLGTYSITTLLEETEVEQILTYTWTFTINTQPATKIDKVRVVTPYASIADVRALAPSEASYDDVKYAETFARLNINQYTGQNFGKRLDAIEMHGNDQAVLVLPHRIIRLDSINIEDDLVWQLDPVINDFGKNVEITDTSYGLRLWKTDNVPVWSDEPTRPYWSKARWYTLAGLYGWDSPPEEVTYCAKLLADDYFCKETAWKKRFVEQINASDWRVVFNQKQFQGTGNFFVDQFLRDFKSIGMVIV